MHCWPLHYYMQFVSYSTEICLTSVWSNIYYKLIFSVFIDTFVTDFVYFVQKRESYILVKCFSFEEVFVLYLHTYRFVSSDDNVEESLRFAFTAVFDVICTVCRACFWDSHYAIHFDEWMIDNDMTWRCWCSAFRWDLISIVRIGACLLLMLLVLLLLWVAEVPMMRASSLR